MDMDFAVLLNTVKDNLGIEEEEINEEELRQEEIQEEYNDNLIKSYNSNLEKIKYPKNTINILNKDDLDKLNNSYKNLNFLKNEYDKQGRIIKIRELKVSVLNMFFKLSCNAIDLSLISKHVCSTCNVIGCNGKCIAINVPVVKKKRKKKDTIDKNTKKVDYYNCSIQIDGTDIRIPLKNLKQFDNQRSYYFNFKGYEKYLPYINKLKDKNEYVKIVKPRIIKIFQNGAITILGLRTTEQGFAMIKDIVDILNSIMKQEPNLTKEVSDSTSSSVSPSEYTSTSSLESTSISPSVSAPSPITLLYKNFVFKNRDIIYNTHLINATYYIDFAINRTVLHKLLVTKYGISGKQCDFIPNAYPAIPIKFYWNIDNKFNGKLGKCTCTKKCNGKGYGQGNGNCKSITITVFATGSISFMGARNEEQLTDCYHFINSILDMEYEQIYKKPSNIIVKTKSPKIKYPKRIKININQISNYNIHSKLHSICI